MQWLHIVATHYYDSILQSLNLVACMPLIFSFTCGTLHLIYRVLFQSFQAMPPAFPHLINCALQAACSALISKPQVYSLLQQPRALSEKPLGLHNQPLITALRTGFQPTVHLTILQNCMFLTDK